MVGMPLTGRDRLEFTRQTTLVNVQVMFQSFKILKNFIEAQQILKQRGKRGASGLGGAQCSGTCLAKTHAKAIWTVG